MDCLFHKAARCLVSRGKSGSCLETTKIPFAVQDTTDRHVDRFSCQISSCIMHVCNFYLFILNTKVHVFMVKLKKKNSPINTDFI